MLWGNNPQGLWDKGLRPRADLQTLYDCYNRLPQCQCCLNLYTSPAKLREKITSAAASTKTSQQFHAGSKAFPLAWPILLIIQQTSDGLTHNAFLLPCDETPECLSPAVHWCWWLPEPKARKEMIAAQQWRHETINEFQTFTGWSFGCVETFRFVRGCTDTEITCSCYEPISYLYIIGTLISHVYVDTHS